MKEGKNTFKHEPSTRKRKNRLLKTASKGFVCTKKLTNASTKKYIVYVQNAKKC